MSIARAGVGCLFKVLAVCLAILFVATTLAVLLLFDAEEKLARPDLYKDIMVRQNLYERLPGLIAEQLVYGGTVAPSGHEEGDETASHQSLVADVIAAASSDLTTCLQSALGPSAYGALGAASRPPSRTEIDGVKSCLRAQGVPVGLAETQGGMPMFFWLLSEEDWRVILTALLPSDWLQAQFERVIDQTYDGLQSDASQAITIDMTGLKHRLQGEEGFAAIVQLIHAQPACSIDQLVQIQGLVDPSDHLGDVPMCNPPEFVLTAIGPNIQATLAFLVDQIPDEAELVSSGVAGSDSEESLASPRRALNTIRAMVRLSLLVPIVMLALVALLGARSIRGLLRWWGVPLLVTGTLGAVAAVAGLIAVHSAISSLVLGRMGASGIAPGMLDAQADALSAIAQGYLTAFLVQAVILALLGLGLVVASVLVRSGAAGRPSADAPQAA